MTAKTPIEGAAKAAVQARIRAHEGVRAKPYQDSLGIWTVGIGRNLEANPFSLEEIELMFQNDYDTAEKGASSFGCWDGLDDVRKGVLLEMVYQMGPSRLKGFRRFLAAMLRRDYKTAADEMLDSRWARQTPGRAATLARIIEKGK